MGRIDTGAALPATSALDLASTPPAAAHDTLADHRHVADFSEFFAVHFPRVARTAYLVVRDREAANDTAQEAFLRALSHWKRVSRYDRPDIWVERVALRLAIRAARRASLFAGPPADSDLVASAPATNIDLLRAVAALPPDSARRSSCSTSRTGR